MYLLLLNRWLVPADEKLDSLARKRYDEQPNVEQAHWHKDVSAATTASTEVPDASAAASATATADVQEEAHSAAVNKKKSKKKKVEYVDLPHGRKVFFLIDCETTGSKRNWDRGISYCIITCDDTVKSLNNFSSLVSYIERTLGLH